MKIIKKLRDIHQESTERYTRLESEVKEKLKPRVEENGWFFIARMKPLESFALKIETGRVPDPTNLEDFFACTIVVPTTRQIEDAESLVQSFYEFSHRRPKGEGKTSKASSDFAFDDLRLYVAQRPQSSGRFPDLDGLIFEIQIKTILQHAWAVATHDLIYKSDTVSWPRERIAFQVKAMLEHAEIAIAEANRLADTPAVSRKDEKTAATLRILEDIKNIWSAERLPNDVKRLAVIILELFKICDLPSDSLLKLIEAEKRRFGLLPADLSPYAFVVQALANSKEVDFEKGFKRRHIRTRLVIHEGMDLPEWMKMDHERILILA